MSSFGTEDRLHRWLRQELRRRGFDRIGDDGAILPEGGPWAVTQDHQIEGVHFPLGTDPGIVAQRLLAVNLSDLAAMGADPKYGFLALGSPAQFDQRRFLHRFLTDCDRHGVELAGGDLTGNTHVVASLTLLGERYAGGDWLERQNGRAGDRLCIAGSLGESALGRRLLELGATLRARRVVLPDSLELSSRQQRLARRAIRQHLLPQPRLEVSRWLSRRRRVAAIDVSDGLALDLHRLCRESAVGAKLEYDALEQGSVFRSLSDKVGRDPRALILNGGEDYALLFALSPRVRPPSSLRCRHVGRLTASTDVTIFVDGNTQPLAARGWDHFESPIGDSS